jgi:hypothetical protein
MNGTNTATVEQELVELNIELGKAEQRREQADVDRLNQLLSDNLIFQRANGAVVNKATYLADLVKPENTFEYLHSEFLEAKVLEDKAVVSLIVRAKGQRGDSQFEGIYRNIRFFLKQDGHWQLSVWHNTKLS